MEGEIEVGTARGQRAVEARDCWLDSLQPDSKEEEWQLLDQESTTTGGEEQDDDMVAK